MAKKHKFSISEIEFALRETRGLQYLAAQKLRCAASTVTNYVKQSAKLQKVIEEEEEKRLDIAEAQLMANITAGDNASVFFFLKTKGKKRGYTERQEISGPDGKQVQFVIETSPVIEDEDEWEKTFKPKPPVEPK